MPHGQKKILLLEQGILSYVVSIPQISCRHHLTLCFLLKIIETPSRSVSSSQPQGRETRVHHNITRRW